MSRAQDAPELEPSPAEPPAVPVAPAEASPAPGAGEPASAPAPTPDDAAPSPQGQEVAPADVVSAPPVAEAQVVDVTVRARSKADTVRESARAVSVVELAELQRSTADMGQVLARTEGVSLRRVGGLGSDARLALNGLSEDQVRVFFDGVPLELAGHPFGINNVPLGLVDRLEIHRGVVPMRLGADAVGGAVELVSDPGVRGTHANLSYMAGSFDTHRLVASGRHLHAPSGLFVRAEGFFDSAENDYPLDLRVNDARGQRTLRVHRKNDAYRAGFGALEAGWVQRPWARRLLLRGFIGDADKEIPSDPLNQVPYGEVRTERRATGALLRYESPSGSDLKLSAVVGYTYRQNRLEDLGGCAYDFTGRCVDVRLPQRGERGQRPYDVHAATHNVLARLGLDWSLGDVHQVRVALSPTATRRDASDRALPAGDVDVLKGDRDLFTLVAGAEYQVDLLEDRLQNIAFVKYYLMLSRSEEQLLSLAFDASERAYQLPGFGDALRLRITDAIYTKLSYERATRMPSPDQLFGDGALVDQNLDLKPESAHNLNLEGALQLDGTRFGDFRVQITGFARFLDDLIAVFVQPESLKFDNVGRARSIGVEGSAGWKSPGGWVALEGNATFQDYTNRSRSGEYGRYRGDRIPNRPYLFANGLAQVFARGLLGDQDELSLSWRTGFVQHFYVGWESANQGGLRIRVPAQVTHTLGLSVVSKRGRTTFSTTIEVQNITDARVFDYYGVQLPGRWVGARFTIGV